MLDYKVLLQIESYFRKEIHNAHINMQLCMLLDVKL